MLQPEVTELKKHNRQLEKTIEMLKIALKQKRSVLSNISAKINEYTVL